MGTAIPKDEYECLCKVENRKFKINTELCIEDPFELERNISQSINFNKLKVFLLKCNFYSLTNEYYFSIGENINSFLCKKLTTKIEFEPFVFVPCYCVIRDFYTKNKTDTLRNCSQMNIDFVKYFLNQILSISFKEKIDPNILTQTYSIENVDRITNSALIAVLSFQVNCQFFISNSKSKRSFKKKLKNHIDEVQKQISKDKAKSTDLKNGVDSKIDIKVPLKSLPLAGGGQTNKTESKSNDKNNFNNRNPSQRKYSTKDQADIRILKPNGMSPKEKSRKPNQKQSSPPIGQNKRNRSSYYTKKGNKTLLLPEDAMNKPNAMKIDNNKSNKTTPVHQLSESNESSASNESQSPKKFNKKKLKFSPNGVSLESKSEIKNKNIKKESSSTLAVNQTPSTSKKVAPNQTPSTLSSKQVASNQTPSASKKVAPNQNPSTSASKQVASNQTPSTSKQVAPNNVPTDCDNEKNSSKRIVSKIFVTFISEHVFSFQLKPDLNINRKLYRTLVNAQNKLCKCTTKSKTLNEKKQN